MRPFTFDLDFGEDIAEKRARLKAEADRLAEEAQRAAEEAEPPPPTFSEQELETAQAAAFEAGRAQGQADAMEAIEARVAAATEDIAQNLPGLFQRQQESLSRLGDEAVELAYVMVRKLVPALAREQAPGEIEAVVRDCLQSLREHPKVSVKVAPALAEPLAARIEAAARDAGFEGQVDIQPDPRLNEGDCVLDWREGGAERITQAIWKEIDHAVERILGRVPEVPDGTA